MANAATLDRIGMNVVLYSRKGCHLCEVADQLLRSHGLRPEIVDIDSDPQLRERYDVSIPVVVIDGRERFFGRVDPVLLKRLLEHGNP